MNIQKLIMPIKPIFDRFWDYSVIHLIKKNKNIYYLFFPLDTFLQYDAVPDDILLQDIIPVPLKRARKARKK